jgi:hypothetical protein
MTKTIKTTTID